MALRTVLPANWRAGLLEVAERGVFVAPLDGQVLATGPDLLAADAAGIARIEALLVALSRTFGEVRWFQCHAEAELFGWARATRGEVSRGYAFASEQHIWWHGEVTEAEHAAGCFVDDPRDTSDDEVKWWPDERLVRHLASAWSIDPFLLGERTGPGGSGQTGSGWVGRL